MQILKRTELTKESSMQVRVKDNGDDFGSCGCGRSPTGKCIGWHGLTEDMYKAKLEEYNLQVENEKSKPD